MRCNPRTDLIGMKPNVRCTFVGSVVSLLTGVERKWGEWVTFVIDLINNHHGFLVSLCSSPWGLLDQTQHVTRGGPNLTTDQISKVLLIAYGCDETQLLLWRVFASITYNRLSCMKLCNCNRLSNQESNTRHSSCHENQDHFQRVLFKVSK